MQCPPYCIFSDILATKSKQCKLKRVENENCIYCGHIHMMIYLFDKGLVLKSIIIGMDLSIMKNRLITIIKYVVYKKFLTEKDAAVNNHENL